ncbi:hypothetical protein [Rhizobium arsenicireducens]
MILEEQDIRQWWYKEGPGKPDPASGTVFYNVAYNPFPLRTGDPPELDAFLRSEMKQRGWWEYERYADEKEAARQLFNAEQRLAAEAHQAQKAADARRRANWSGPLQIDAMDKITKERERGGNIVLTILVVVLLGGILVKCMGLGGPGHGCGRADEWQCDR